MPEWAYAIALKLAGSVAGSALSAWFRKSVRWGFQTVSGIFVGYVSAPWLIDFLGWMPSPDYILFAGSIMGVVGYSIFEGILSIDFKAIAKWYADRKTGAAEPEKP